MKVTEDVRQVDLSVKMTGKERYPILGWPTEKGDPSLRAQAELGVIQSKFKGLSLYGSCVEKNWIAKRYLPGYVMVMGDVRVVSGDNKSAYGHDFNPPTELHAWLMNEGGFTADFALPGLIMCGMKECDEQGPFIVGREPAILIGKAPTWVQYRVRHVIDDVKVNAIVLASS